MEVIPFCRDCSIPNSETKCERFVANPFKRNKCSSCSHEIEKHEGTTQAEQAAGNLAKDDSHPTPILDSFLFMGSMQSSLNRSELKEKKITHIINCAKDIHVVWPKFKQFPDEFTYLNLRLEDDGLIDITQERWKEIMEFMSTAHSSGGGVLVHCAQGVNRSGTVVCAYLMVSQKWKYEKALEIARKGRAICQPNKQYERQLKAMESFLHTLNV